MSFDFGSVVVCSACASCSHKLALPRCRCMHTSKHECLSCVSVYKRMQLQCDQPKRKCYWVNNGTGGSIHAIRARFLRKIWIGISFSTSIVNLHRSIVNRWWRPISEYSVVFYICWIAYTEHGRVLNIACGKWHRLHCRTVAILT